MALFTSSRERLFWTTAILVQLIIYSTLGVQPKLAELMRSLGLIELTYFIGFFLLIIALSLLGFVRNVHWSRIALAIGILSIVSFGISRIGLAEERTHLIEYAFIGILVYMAVDERSNHRTTIMHPVLLAIIITGLAGILDEVLQYFIPGRVFDTRDILFNVLAGSGSVIMIFLINKLFKKAR